MDFDESAEEAAFRAEAHAWLSAHATLKDPDKSTPMSMGEADAEAEREHVRQSKAWQRTLFDGGWAGITWPKEYGGRGATPIEAIIFGQEQARFDVPDQCLRPGHRHGRPHHHGPRDRRPEGAISRDDAAGR